MNAEKITGSTVSGKRTKLADVIPLNTPYLVQVFPAYACNFACNYCTHSLSPEKRGFIANKSIMDYDLYTKCIDDLKNFPQKIKMLRFAATGEPLLHPQIAEMVSYAKKSNIADSIDIVTNAALLTEDLSDRLIDAGLDWLRISLQGLSSEKYKEICKAEISFDKLLKNIRYFYEKRKNTKVYIKIIDSALEIGEEEEFYKKFGDICDAIGVEYLIPATEEIDYNNVFNRDFDSTQNGNPLENVEVCPQPFYMLQVNPDGHIVPCCSMETAYISGNAYEESLLDIWTGNKLKDFRLQLLSKQKNAVCKRCESYKFGMFEEDILDNKAKELKKILQAD